MFGWSKKRRDDGTDDGTPGGQYAKGHCPVVVYVRRCDGHTTGHWPVALFKRRNRRWDTFHCPSLCGSSSRF